MYVKLRPSAIHRGLPPRTGATAFGPSHAGNWHIFQESPSAKSTDLPSGARSENELMLTPTLSICVGTPPSVATCQRVCGPPSRELKTTRRPSAEMKG